MVIPYAEDIISRATVKITHLLTWGRDEEIGSPRTRVIKFDLKTTIARDSTGSWPRLCTNQATGLDFINFIIPRKTTCTAMLIFAPVLLPFFSENLVFNISHSRYSDLYAFQYPTLQLRVPYIYAVECAVGGRERVWL